MIYEFYCKECDRVFDVTLLVKDRNLEQLCPYCKEIAKRVEVPSGLHIVFKGDDWPSKAIRVNKQMIARRQRTGEKQKARVCEVPSLVPNVDGEKVDSWQDAKKLAGEKGKDASTYDAFVGKK